jgi:hypothetical protein
MRLFLILALLTNMTFAGEVLLKASPVSEFKTTSKTVVEGSEVSFKTDKGIITGVVTYYEPNGFFGKNAEVIIGNFKTEDGKSLKGKMYLTGGEHKVFQEYLNQNDGINSLALPFLGYFIRGSEVILAPGEIIEFFTEE